MGRINVGRTSAGVPQSIPGYSPTPLVAVPALAESLGAEQVWIKDESDRFGLPAFKVLGASWATNLAVSARAGPSAGPDVRRILRGYGTADTAGTADGGDRDGRQPRPCSRAHRQASRPDRPHLRPGRSAGWDAEGDRRRRCPGRRDQPGLLALTDGLGLHLLSRQLTAADAMVAMDTHLDLVFDTH
ncbi:hypothetical protein PWY36_05330 [Kribbella solani]|nr:hypothetical protein [Kribbella solani]MDX2968583.1 hypothetical protein [Kribbella solani]